MKVLQINTVCGVGSTGRIATDINQILIEQGHESYIAYGRDFPKNCDTAIRIGTKMDNYAHVALTRIYDKHGFGSKKATEEFITKIEKLDPDVIHLHNIHGYYINIELLFDYIKRANKRVIWTLHDCWAFTGHCTHFDYVGCTKWKKGCFNCPEKASYPASEFLDNSESNYLRKKEIFTGVKDLTIVTPSKWLTGLVKESFLRDYPVVVINNGININVFKPTASTFREMHHLNDKFIILGVASNWGRKKGFDYFIELSSFLDEDEVIVLVGVSEKQKKELSKKIIGIIRTDSAKELVGIYSAADVFINPTLEDNFPTTNLEALASGTPVITFDSGGSTESLDETCGLIIEKKETIEIKNYIKRYREENFIKSKSCIERSKMYNVENQYREYMKLYLGEDSKVIQKEDLVKSFL
ncbi:glycosyl transferase [Lysinibacillus contaminans]|uniref:Glycosyl transferase n=1 Tax=Lysinibacillus contaminans TaxID=1293441 RepID=A0ABR5K373_9BACI|nr:glycosyltransferase [Lysinibacillus contaminans]KOS69382.1 glycosyl transferase [Lysinibacillus contaminans]